MALRHRLSIRRRLSLNSDKAMWRNAAPSASSWASWTAPFMMRPFQCSSMLPGTLNESKVCPHTLDNVLRLVFSHTILRTSALLTFGLVSRYFVVIIFSLCGGFSFPSYTQLLKMNHSGMHASIHEPSVNTSFANSRCKEWTNQRTLYSQQRR